MFDSETPTIWLAGTPKFELGAVVLTANCGSAIDSRQLAKALSRHAQGDWGRLCESDQQQNEEALQGSGRLFSAYEDDTGRKFWIITEWDRSVTTILLPQDY